MEENTEKVVERRKAPDKVVARVRAPDKVVARRSEPDKVVARRSRRDRSLHEEVVAERKTTKRKCVAGFVYKE
jgi:hypothetical protein